MNAAEGEVAAAGTLARQQGQRHQALPLERALTRGLGAHGARRPAGGQPLSRSTLEWIEGRAWRPPSQTLRARFKDQVKAEGKAGSKGKPKDDPGQRRGAPPWRPWIPKGKDDARGQARGRGKTQGKSKRPDRSRKQNA